jgi:hypothetical protein
MAGVTKRRRNDATRERSTSDLGKPHVAVTPQATAASGRFAENKRSTSERAAIGDLFVSSEDAEG